MEVVVRRAVVRVLKKELKALDFLNRVEERIDRLRHLDYNDEFGLLRPDGGLDPHPLGIERLAD
ncbi:MAG: hypothetical protein F4078_04735 [Acidimicrobiia bacterium]|nr:hypothetical protein [Acidimicrobiia bacterium]